MTDIFLRDVLTLPESVHAGDFKVELTGGFTEAATVERVREYVVTDQLRRAFREALSVVRSAVRDGTSHAAYLHGSFGSGKSHFLTVLHAVLNDNPEARAKPGLQPVIAEHDEWLRGKRFLMVPYHLVGATDLDAAILGGYVAHVRRTEPEASIPAVYRSDAMLDDARRQREFLADDAAFARWLGADGPADPDDLDVIDDASAGWSTEELDAAFAAPPGTAPRRALESALLSGPMSSYARGAHGDAEAFVPLENGLAVIAEHARSLGYHGLILFLDELILWLQAHMSNQEFVNTQVSKLVKLIESGVAERALPIVSFISRQRDLSKLVGEDVTGADVKNLEAQVEYLAGRFDVVNLEDTNLPAIVRERVLRPRPGKEALLDQAFAVDRVQPAGRPRRAPGRDRRHRRDLGRLPAGLPALAGAPQRSRRAGRRAAARADRAQAAAGDALSPARRHEARRADPTRRPVGRPRRRHRRGVHRPAAPRGRRRAPVLRPGPGAPGGALRRRDLPRLRRRRPLRQDALARLARAAAARAGAAHRRADRRAQPRLDPLAHRRAGPDGGHPAAGAAGRVRRAALRGRSGPGVHAAPRRPRRGAAARRRRGEGLAGRAPDLGQGPGLGAARCARLRRVRQPPGVRVAGDPAHRRVRVRERPRPGRRARPAVHPRDAGERAVRPRLPVRPRVLARRRRPAGYPAAPGRGRGGDGRVDPAAPHRAALGPARPAAQDRLPAGARPSRGVRRRPVRGPAAADAPAAARAAGEPVVPATRRARAGLRDRPARPGHRPGRPRLRDDAPVAAEGLRAAPGRRRVVRAERAAARRRPVRDAAPAPPGLRPRADRPGDHARRPADHAGLDHQGDGDRRAARGRRGQAAPGRPPHRARPGAGRGRRRSAHALGRLAAAYRPAGGRARRDR